MRTVIGIGGIFALGLVACVGEEPIVGSSTAENTGEGAGGGPPSSTRYVVKWLAYHEPPEPFCLPTRLGIDSSGRSTCDLVAVSSSPDGTPISDIACDCAGRGLAPPTPEAKQIVLAEMERAAVCFTRDPPIGALPCSEVCLCDVPQAEGESWQDCEYNVSPSPESRGFCYIEPGRGVGARALVEGCFEPWARVRALGGVLSDNQDYFALCHDASSIPEVPAEGALPVGSPCVPPEESIAGFSGYDELEVSVLTGVDACTSGLGVVNHFRGRASCPYGQTEEQARNDPQCFLPGSDVAVTTAVIPQLRKRGAQDHVTCSCRCDGPGPGNYCGCPGGTECLPLIEPLGLPGDAALAGSYCVPTGTAFNLQSLDSETCFSEIQNCGDARPY